MARSDSLEGVQVINKPNVILKKGSEDDWKITRGLSKDCENLALEVEILLNDLAKKTKKLNDKLKEAYVAAPEKDSGFGYSPINPTRVMHAVKSHLLKHQLRVDNMPAIEESKIKNFSDYISESLKWLLKFSN